MSNFYFAEPECVFIHIPKTAGSSIRLGLLGGKYLGPAQGEIPPEWQHCFKFAFVRNPYDRLISAWRMFTVGMQRTHWEQPDDLDRTMTLKKFLAIVTDESIPFNTPIRTRTDVKIRHHTIPQTHPFNCLEHANFVGRFESLRDDLAVLCEKLDTPFDLPHLNQSDRKHYQDYFDDETMQIASDFYRQDLDLLGYKF